jgi:hypothetical protein
MEGHTNECRAKVRALPKVAHMPYRRVIPVPVSVLQLSLKIYGFQTQVL